MRSVLAQWACFVFFIGGCDGCDDVPDDLRVEGPQPYVHCAAAEPLEAREWKVDDLRLDIEGRILRIAPEVWPLRIAAFSGPGFSDTPPEASLKRAMAAHPDVFLVLGSIGDTQEIAEGTLAALARHAVPSLVIAGGRDAWDVLQEALDGLDAPARSHIIDATRLRRVIIRDNTLHIVAGAVDGRYARNADACGVPSETLAGRAATSSEQRRDWLIGWQAPRDAAPRGVATSGDGLKVGPQAVTSFAQRMGHAGGLFAVPHFQVMRPFTAEGTRMVAGEVSGRLRLIVPRLAGPRMERADGSWASPGFALVELGDAGLRLLSPSSPADDG